MNKRQLRKIVILFSFLSITLAGGGLSYYYLMPRTGIYAYTHQDKQFILDIFKKDWYWLVEGTGFSPEQMLDEGRHYEMKKPITIKIAYERGNPVGFIVYYKVNFYLGKIWFIDVLQEVRSKGWGFKLLQHAVQDLIKQGASRIDLITRTANVAAQGLYKKIGFVETNKDDKFVNFSYYVQQ